MDSEFAMFVAWAIGIEAIVILGIRIVRTLWRDWRERE